ncbi:MAG: hypothetical protein QHH04_02815 [Methanolinea sp.]|nr:hypothetical protein [Methanolinea sp.]
MRLPAAILVISLCLLALSSPAGATVVARDILVEPTGVILEAGNPVNLTAIAEIIPSGASTFSESHTLSFSTGLPNARWEIVVTVDGRQGAVIHRDGRRVFLNGYLLSYPTTRDVGLVIGLRGEIPPNLPDERVILLEWEELNAGGQVVTGSVYQVSRATGPASPAGSSTPEPTITTYPSVSAPTEVPFPMISLLLALCLFSARVAFRKS